MPTSIHGTNGITFNDGSTQNTRPAVGFRNRIINGDMRIDQRNAGSSATATNGIYTLDRWVSIVSPASKFTVQRSTVTPSGAGFTNSLLATSTSAYSVASGDYNYIVHKLEGSNVADLMWGTANAKAVTISFWARSSLTGTFVVGIRGGGLDAGYPATYTINSANTWEYKSITISGATSGTFPTDSTECFGIWFNLGAGSVFNGTANTWGNQNVLSVSGAISLVGTNGATFYITGVQLEVGSTATEFERRPIGTELALCQRYFEKTYDVDTAQATATNLGMAYVGSTATGIYGLGGVQFVSNKRSIPAIRYWDGAGNENKCSYIVNGSGSTSFVANTNLASAPYNISTRGFLVGANIIANSASYIHYTANSEL